MIVTLSAGPFGNNPPTPRLPASEPLHRKPISLSTSTPKSPTRTMPPLVTGLPSKPWVSRPHSPADLSPSTVPDLVTDSETELDTPVHNAAGSRKDGSHATKANDEDPHVQQTVQSYIKRPLPEPPTAPPSRSASPGVVKPWLNDSEHQQPVNPSKFTLFPKSTFKVGLPASPARPARLPAKQTKLPSPPLPLQPASILLPATKFTPGLNSNPSGRARPTMKEHRSQTDPQVMTPATDSAWSPRSVSLNRNLTAPLDSPRTSRPSTSAPPRASRCPSAIDIIAAHEIDESTQLKAGPGHQYQLQYSPVPEAAIQAAHKWIQRRERVKRQPAGRTRSPSTPDDSIVVGATLTSPVGMPDFPSELMIELIEDTEDLDSPTLPLPYPPMRFDSSETEIVQVKEVEEQDGEDLRRGRTLQRSFVGPLFTLGDLLSSPSPTFSPTFSSATAWTLPPAKGPLQIRASAFQPFSPQLDSGSLDIPDVPAIPIMAAMPAMPVIPVLPDVPDVPAKTDPVEEARETPAHSISLALLPATTYVRDPSPVRKPKKQQQLPKVPMDEREGESHASRKVAEQHLPPPRQHKKSVSEASNRPPEKHVELVRAARSMSLALAKPLPPPPPSEIEIPRRERGRLESKYYVNRSPSPLAVLAAKVRL